MVNTLQADGLARILGLTPALYKAHPQPPNSMFPFFFFGFESTQLARQLSVERLAVRSLVMCLVSGRWIFPQRSFFNLAKFQAEFDFFESTFSFFLSFFGLEDPSQSLD